MKKENNEIKSTAHSKYRCQYHIVFAPKYRRKEIYGTLKRDIGEILRKLCEQKGVEIIEAEACPDHIHMLVSIPPHLSIGSLFVLTPFLALNGVWLSALVSWTASAIFTFILYLTLKYNKKEEIS